jgi:FkbM family methyltransferase
MQEDARTRSAVAKVSFEGRTSLIHYNNPADHIQSFHKQGVFYELRQLEAHRDLIPMRSTILDIGANVGNHTLFYAMHTWGGLVYPFEPNIAARDLLLASLNDNSDYRARVDIGFVSYAVGREECKLRVASKPANNLGGVSLGVLSGDEAEPIDCVRLDDLSFEGDVRFIKIDVEGMELDVLAGAERLISRFRPTLAIEVAESHDDSFWKWLQAHRYQVVSVFFDYLHFKNYIAIPTGGDL